MHAEHSIPSASGLHTGPIARRAGSIPAESTATASPPADSIAADSNPTAVTNSTPTLRTPTFSLEQLSDEQLIAQTRQLVGHSNRVLATLLAHLAEVEARGVHRIRACSSLYTYCIYELRFSEDEAARRVSAARLVRRFPALFAAVERGELHLTGLLLLGPHLTAENHHEVLARTKHRTKKEIQKLVRELCPMPDVPACIEPLGPAGSGVLGVEPSWEGWVQSLCPVRELGPGQRPADWLEAPMTNAGASQDDDRAALDVAAPARVHPTRPDVAAPARVEPARPDLRSDRATGVASVTGPQRYRVQFTAGERYVELVERARALMSYSAPNAPLEDLHMHAMQALVVDLEKRRYAVTKQPRRATPDCASSVHDAAHAASPAGRESTGPAHDAEHDAPADAGEERDAAREHSRRVPAEVRRSVFERDGGRCTYVDDRGERCRETQLLELHHVEPFAKGGAHHAANVCLRCRAHNTLAAEQDFGRSFIRHCRAASRHEPASVQTRLPH